MSDEAILRRLERLERDNRRWKRAAAVTAVLVAAVGIMGQGRYSRIVEAEKFVLRDAEGRTRAEWLVEAEESVALRFKDSVGTPRLTLGTENNSSVLVLNEKSGRVRAGLVALPHGAPGLSLYDVGGKARAELLLTREGMPSLGFFDRDGFPVTKYPK